MGAGTLKHLYNAHLRKLEEAGPAWKLAPRDLFNLLASADPSSDPAYGLNRKRYLDWLLQQAGRGHLNPDNLATTTLALRLHCAQNGATHQNEPVDMLVSRMLSGPRARLRIHLAQEKHRTPWKKRTGFPVDENSQADFVLDALLSTDPTGGRYLPHLMRWLEAPVIPLGPDDLDEVGEDLKLLHRNFRPDLAAQTHLDNCSRWTDLASTVDRFAYQIALSGEKRQAFEQTALRPHSPPLAREITDTPDFRLLQVLDEKGAILLGRNTRWCTRHDSGSEHKNEYGKYGAQTLYLRSKPDNRIYQFHFPRWMFHDHRNNPVRNFAEFASRYPGLATAVRDFVLPVICCLDLDTDDSTNDEAGWINRTIEQLAFCRLDPKLKEAADSVAGRLIPKVLSRATRQGKTKEMVNFLAHCHHDPAYGKIACGAALAPIRDSLINDARWGRADEVAALLKFCHSHGLPYRDWANRLAPDIIPEALQNSISQTKIFGHNVLMDFCQSVPEYKDIATGWLRQGTKRRIDVRRPGYG